VQVLASAAAVDDGVEAADQPAGERLREPGAGEDQQDVPGARQRDARLGVQALQVLEDVPN